MILGEAICSVHIQPEGFGPPPQQQLGGYKKEYSHSFQSTEQKSGGQTFQQRSYQHYVDNQSYTNGSNNISIEDFKVSEKEFNFILKSEYYLIFFLIKIESFTVKIRI